MTYCADIYKGLFLDPDTNSVRVSPCCNMRGPSVDTLDFQSNQLLDHLRKENKQGIRSEACNACWKIEDAGGESRRQASNRHLSSLQDTDTNVELLFLDYNVTWACNSACIMCYPEFSSLWAKELGISKNIERAQKTNNDTIDSLDFSKIKKIHFNGGEPLINNEHRTILEKVPDLSDVQVSYNTNGTLYPDDSVIKLWAQCRAVRLFYSIDALGTAFNYIRWPGNWDDTEKNIKKMKKNLPDNVLFGLNVTIGSYNLLEIPDVYNWYVAYLLENRAGYPSEFVWQIAENYHPRNLNLDIKQECLSKFEQYNQLQSLYTFIQQDIDVISSNSNTWIHKLEAIDLRRKTSWREQLKVGKYYK